MGDRYFLPIVVCPKCGHKNEDESGYIYFAPTCGFDYHICEKCGHRIDLCEYTGLSYEDCSNADQMKQLAEAVKKKYKKS